MGNKKSKDLQTEEDFYEKVDPKIMGKILVKRIFSLDVLKRILSLNLVLLETTKKNSRTSKKDTNESTRGSLGLNVLESRYYYHVAGKEFPPPILVLKSSFQKIAELKRDESDLKTKIRLERFGKMMLIQNNTNSREPEKSLLNFYNSFFFKIFEIKAPSFYENHDISGKKIYSEYTIVKPTGKLLLIKNDNIGFAYANPRDWTDFDRLENNGPIEKNTSIGDLKLEIFFNSRLKKVILSRICKKDSTDNEIQNKVFDLSALDFLEKYLEIQEEKYRFKFYFQNNSKITDLRIYSFGTKLSFTNEQLDPLTRLNYYYDYKTDYKGSILENLFKINDDVKINNTNFERIFYFKKEGEEYLGALLKSMESENFSLKGKSSSDYDPKEDPKKAKYLLNLAKVGGERGENRKIDVLNYLLIECERGQEVIVDVKFRLGGKLLEIIFNHKILYFHLGKNCEVTELLKLDVIEGWKIEYLDYEDGKIIFGYLSDDQYLNLVFSIEDKKIVGDFNKKL